MCRTTARVPGAILLGMRIFLSGSHTGKYPRNLSRLSSNGLALYILDINVAAVIVAIGTNVFDDNQHHNTAIARLRNRYLVPIFRTKHSHIMNGCFLDLFIGGVSRQSQSYGISILFGKFSSEREFFLGR